jgi:hypothetical protein
VPRTCDVYEDAPHQLGREPEEMRATLPLHLLTVDQAQVGLIHESGGLKHVPGALAGHVPSGEAVQLPMDGWREAIEGRVIAVAPGDK